MATKNFSNLKAYPAANGQAVLVTLGSAVSGLENIAEGNLVTTNYSNPQAEGVVERINIYGNSFWVSPRQMNKSFQTFGQVAGLYGYLENNAVVVVTY